MLLIMPTEQSVFFFVLNVVLSLTVVMYSKICPLYFWYVGKVNVLLTLK